jgi:hypothetical protein
MLITIPTCRSEEEVSSIVCDLEGYAYGKHQVFATCKKVSSSENRNTCLSMVPIGDVIIMIDDDMAAFYDGFVEDLTYPLLHDEDVIMSSARLMKADGTIGTMSGENYDMSAPVVEVRARQLPTACVAFRNDGTRFDERFKGSGYEDTWFCDCLAKKYPHGKFVIVNKCMLVHLNEQKGAAETLEHNQRVYQALCAGKQI